MKYTFGSNVSGTIDSVRERVEVALAEEGFGILTTIDVAGTFKAKLGIERDPYVILGACNPNLAHEAIGIDADIGALLPCNVVLRQEGDEVAIRFMDPAAVLGIVDTPEISHAADEARARLERVSSAISS